MSAHARFMLFQFMIIVPFLAGTILKNRIPAGSFSSRKLIRFNLIFIEPCIALWSIWGLDFGWDVIVLPISGLLLVLAGMAAGKMMLALAPLEGKLRASFLISSSLANHGFTMGAFLCYLFLGERGLGLAFLFLSYFMLFVFTVIFPYARSASSLQEDRPRMIWSHIFDLQNMPLFAVLLGLIFKASGLARPSIFFPIDALMLLSIALYYFSMGMSFSIGNIFLFLRENISLSLIKFLMVPALTAAVLGLLEIDREIESVIRLESFMPAAIYSVVASVLFQLDTKLTSNLFVVNTLAFIFLVLPLLFVFKGYILGL